MHELNPIAVMVRPRRMVVIVAAISAFLAYSCVYAFRKPFTIDTFGGLKYGGVSFQTILIISQVIGYMLSKFFGIKFIGEMKHHGRFRAALILVGIAWACLFLFAVCPPLFGILFFFINGFVLGFLWGIIFSYLEGRRSTDFMGAIMAVSFIFAGGFTRSVGKWLIVQYQVTETWMPFLTGLLFAGPLVFFLWVLDKIPAPDEGDIEERTERKPMDLAERKKLLRSFGSGIIVVAFTYTILTVMRDIRDNYMANIWNELGYGSDYSVFTKTETNTSLVIIAMMGLLVLVRKNFRAFRISHLIIASGLILACVSSILFILGVMNGAWWMQLTSLGLYMGYIPFNCIFFERMIAAFRIRGNVGFLIYFADAFGYLGSVVVMLTKEFLPQSLNWSSFYSQGVVIFGIVGLAGTIYSYFYFLNKHKWQKDQLL